MPLAFDLRATVKHIWHADPAIDFTDQDKTFAAYKEFIEKRTDEARAAIPMRAGCTPAVFTLKPLTRKVWVTLPEPPLVRASEIVAYGLANLEGYIVNGEPVKFDTKETDRGKRVTDAVLDAIYRPDLFDQLAGHIVALSFPGPYTRVGLRVLPWLRSHEGRNPIHHCPTCIAALPLDTGQRQRMHCGWLPRDTWSEKMESVPESFGPFDYKTDDGTPVDVCPGWLVRQPAVIDGAKAAMQAAKGTLELNCPDGLMPILEAVDESQRADALFEQEQIAEMKRRNANVQ